MGEDVAGHFDWPQASGLIESEDEAGLSLSSSSGSNNLVTHISGPRHVHFSVLDTRLLSFHDWPISMPQKARALAEAGFFYLGRGDKVQCYSCDGGVHNWMAEDDPWEEHAKWMPHCNFLNLVKGPDFVRRVQHKLRNPHLHHHHHHHQDEDDEHGRDHGQLEVAESTTPSPSGSMSWSSTSTRSSSSPSSLSSNTRSGEAEVDVKALLLENRRLCEARLCKICLSNELGIVFVPCGHLATCPQCASAFTKCPVCRQHIEKAVRTFLS